MHKVLINAGKCEGEINCTTQMEVNKLSENCARGEVDYELIREIETPGLPCRVRRLRSVEERLYEKGKNEKCDRGKRSEAVETAEKMKVLYIITKMPLWKYIFS